MLRPSDLDRWLDEDRWTPRVNATQLELCECSDCMTRDPGRAARIAANAKGRSTQARRRHSSSDRA